MTANDEVAPRGEIELAPAPARGGRGRHRDPLVRNGTLLTVSALITSALGAAYWALVTRWYDPAAVGRNYAAVTMMMFLSNLGQLNLNGMLIRFSTVVGTGVRRLVFRAYAAASVATAVITTGFVVLIPWVAPDLAFLHDPLFGLFFVVATAGYSLFVLQDGALTGLRRPGWLVAENAVFAVAKIVFVILLAATSATVGILVSWIVALALSLIMTNAVLVSIMPRPKRRGGRSDEMRPPGLLKFVAADYVGSLFRFAAASATGLVVLNLVGAERNAYYSLAGVVSGSLYLVAHNMGDSLVVEGSADPHSLGRRCRTGLLHSLRTTVVGVVLVVAAAPWILRVFGAGYAEHGTDALRLLALSAIPHVVVMTAINSGRVTRTLWLIIGVPVAMLVLGLGMTVPMTQAWGIAGAGAASLLSMTLLAVALLVVRRTWMPPATDAPVAAIEGGEPSEPPSAAGADTAEVRPALPAARAAGARPGPYGDDLYGDDRGRDRDDRGAQGDRDHGRDGDDDGELFAVTAELRVLPPHAAMPPTHTPTPAPFAVETYGVDLESTLTLRLPRFGQSRRNPHPDADDPGDPRAPM